MSKFTKIVILWVALVCVNQARAGLILTDLTEDNYITHENLQWAWASPVNSEYFNNQNRLYAPDLHAGWRFATDEELNVLKFELTLADFTRPDGTYIHAVEYWNSDYDNVSDWNNVNNFINDLVASQWSTGVNSYYETFYVRDVIQVNEPAMFVLFLLAVLVLFRKPMTHFKTECNS